MTTKNQVLEGGKWKEIVREYQSPNFLKATGQIFTSVIPYLGMMVLMYFTLGISYWLTLLLAIPTAGFAVRTFIIFHDCGHQSFWGSKNKRANDITGVITGILTFTPYHIWRRAHAKHHATVGKLDQRGKGDVWMLTTDEWEGANQWKRLAYRTYRFPLILFTIGAWLNILVFQRVPIGKLDRQDKTSILLTDLALAIIILLVCMLIGVKAYLLVQLPAMMIAASAGVWLFYVQHQFPGAYWARGREWKYIRACMEGSSFYKLPRVFQFFTGSIGFHHIHHLSHLIPNYRLEDCFNEHPELAIKPITLKDTLALSRIRLWDESIKTYVGFP
jgi:acyl-lipid omega-6 desaturase (Delta-12 desaturase)